jgi:hypothetical protein
MKRIHIIGIAFAAIFAFSMVSASGASALTLWDECSQSATTLSFASADCNTTGSAWGWLPIAAKTPVDSLPVNLILRSTGIVTVEILCEGSQVGTVGPTGEDEITEILTLAGVAITLTNLVVCTNISGCPEPLASPENLPWKTQLVNETTEDAAGDLLGGGTKEVGYFVECMGNGQTNECLTTDTILKVENLEAELEVDLTFPLSTETKNLPLAVCKNELSNDGFVEGTVSILLSNSPERALRAD